MYCLVKDRFPDTMDVSVELIRPEDGGQVIRFLKDNFFEVTSIILRLISSNYISVSTFCVFSTNQDEPMNASLDLGECKELERYSECCIGDELSFKAISIDTAEILGVVISGFKTKSEDSEAELEYSDQYKSHKKFYNIIQITQALEDQMNVFELCPNQDRVVEGRILCVSKRCRGAGIAGKLVRATLDKMIAVQVPLFYILCSGHYSARVMEKLEFKEIGSIKYSEFLVQGEQVLRPASPHESIKGFIKWAFTN